MNATILSAGCLEMIPSFDLERVLELMAGRVTKLFSVPTGMSACWGWIDSRSARLGSLLLLKPQRAWAAKWCGSGRIEQGCRSTKGNGMTKPPRP